MPIYLTPCPFTDNYLLRLITIFWIHLLEYLLILKIGCGLLNLFLFMAENIIAGMLLIKLCKYYLFISNYFFFELKTFHNFLPDAYILWRWMSERFSSGFKSELRAGCIMILLLLSANPFFFRCLFTFRKSDICRSVKRYSY